VLAFRRALVKDILRALNAPSEQLAQVDQMQGDALRTLEDQVTRRTLIPGYHQFWTMQRHLGLPDPFSVFPVQPALDGGIELLRINGFGPSTYAFENWRIVYMESRGMNPGVDYLVPAGSPLVAVADGEIVEFAFLSDPAERSVALRPFLPGTRTLSNLIVGYGHLTHDGPDDRTPVGTQVRAGQVIGTSGYPVHTQVDGDVTAQRHNAHLHLQTHFVTDSGAEGERTFHAGMPVNPLLFFAPQWVAFQARLAKHDDRPPYPQVGQPFGKLGFFELGCFRLQPPSIVWEYEPSRGAIWPEGVYALDAMIEYVAGFGPYTM
jgi:hypothetical protein